MNAIAKTPVARETTSKRRSPMLSSVILVATDGTESSHGAYTAAELIAGETRALVHVLSVVELLPDVAQLPGSTIPSPGIEESTKDVLRADMVQELLKRGRLGEWTTEILLGRPATVIAEVAREREVDLIIVGAAHHGIVDRLLGEETASNLARLVQRPLLVASPSIERLPKRVVVGLDLESANRETLVNTLEILGSPENVSVVHVTPRSEALGIDWAEFDDEYRADVGRAYGELFADLSALPRIRPELVIKHGEVAREISQFAESVKAEMIVLGVKHRRPFGIAPGGGIAMRITRSARCSVLLIPKDS